LEELKAKRNTERRPHTAKEGRRRRVQPLAFSLSFASIADVAVVYTCESEGVGSVY
jgi:hypothetical protein